jgi:hypothetical protein
VPPSKQSRLKWRSPTQSDYASKIRRAVDNAIGLIEKILTAKENEQEAVKRILWHAAEETEYAAALLSLAQGFTDLDPRLESDLKRMTTRGKLSQAKAFLQEGLPLLEDNGELCYVKLRYAVQALRSAQVASSRRKRASARLEDE